MEGMEVLEERYVDSDNEEFDEVEYVDGEDDESFYCIVQRLLLALGESKIFQRHTIFKTNCTIKKQVFDVIIDSGSNDYFVSKHLVKTLGLVA